MSHIFILCRFCHCFHHKTTAVADNDDNIGKKKTQLQLQSRTKGAQLPYTGMVSGLTYTVRNTGFFSLYRGLAPTLIGSVPKAGIRFGLNSVIKEKLRDPTTGNLTPAKNFVAGLGAGVAEALVIVAPVETVKTKVIELNMAFLPGLKHILQTQGLAGVYQGVSWPYVPVGGFGSRFVSFLLQCLIVLLTHVVVYARMTGCCNCT